MSWFERPSPLDCKLYIVTKRNTRRYQCTATILKTGASSMNLKVYVSKACNRPGRYLIEKYLSESKWKESVLAYPSCWESEDRWIFGDHWSVSYPDILGKWGSRLVRRDPVQKKKLGVCLRNVTHGCPLASTHLCAGHFPSSLSHTWSQGVENSFCDQCKLKGWICPKWYFPSQMRK